MNDPAPADFHARVRRQIREDSMDAALRILLTDGWQAVRMTAIATAVGVSRQTLYKEFSSKEEIGHALVMREVDRFIEGVTASLASVTDVPTMIETAIRFGFVYGSANRILIAILTGTRDKGDSLLPFVTTEAGALFAKAATVMADPILRLAPDLDPEDVVATSDAIVRLLVSHLLQPLGDTETAIQRLTRLAHRGLGLPS